MPRVAARVRRLPFDHHVFLGRFDSNHCHAVYGDRVEKLRMIRRMLGVEAEVLG